MGIYEQPVFPINKSLNCLVFIFLYVPDTKRRTYHIF
jgi:hypothetical protein